MRRNSGSSCDLLSLATVRSHRGGRLQAESSLDKEEKASCLNSKEEGRSVMERENSADSYFTKTHSVRISGAL